MRRLKILLLIAITVGMIIPIWIYFYNQAKTILPPPSINGYILGMANQPIAGVPIMLYPLDRDECLYTSISKPSGKFFIPKPPPGNYILKSILNNEKISTMPIEVLAESQYIQIQLTYEEANRLPAKGKLISSISFLKDGKTPTPITGCSITFSHAKKRMTFNSVVDAQGKATVEIPPGKYQFTATLSDVTYQSLTDIEATIYDQQTTEINLIFKINPQTIIPKGYVAGDVTVNEKPLVQGMLELYGSHIDQQNKQIPISYQIPLQEGRFRLEMPPGQYTFAPQIPGSEFIPSGEVKFTVVDKQTCQISIAFTSPRVVAVNPPEPTWRPTGLRPPSHGTPTSSNENSSVQVTVIDASWSPQFNAQVVIINKATGEQREAQTNTEGEIHFKDITPGEYDVKAEFNGLKGRCELREEFSAVPGKLVSLVLRETE